MSDGLLSVSPAFFSNRIDETPGKPGKRVLQARNPAVHNIYWELSILLAKDAISPWAS